VAQPGAVTIAGATHQNAFGDDRDLNASSCVAIVAGRALDPRETFGVDLDYVRTSPHAFTPNHRGREIIKSLLLG
jgi:hypothetical protein